MSINEPKTPQEELEEAFDNLHLALDKLERTRHEIETIVIPKIKETINNIIISL